MTLKAQILEDVKTAMRARDQRRLTALRLITAAIKQIEVDKRIELDDQAVLGVLDKMVKQRRESIAQFKTAGRDDLVKQENFEIDIIQEFLPQALSEEEVDAIVNQAIEQTGASSIKDMGKVMGGIKAELNLALMMVKRQRIIGSVLRSRPLAEKTAITEEFKARILPRLADGSIVPIIDHVFGIFGKPVPDSG